MEDEEYGGGGATVVRPSICGQLLDIYLNVLTRN